MKHNISMAWPRTLGSVTSCSAMLTIVQAHGDHLLEYNTEYISIICVYWDILGSECIEWAVNDSWLENATVNFSKTTVNPP